MLTPSRHLDSRNFRANLHENLPLLAGLFVVCLQSLATKRIQQFDKLNQNDRFILELLEDCLTYRPRKFKVR
jgi:hypothetical protein